MVINNIMDNYNPVEFIEYVSDEKEIKNHFLNSEKEIKKGISSVELINFNKENNFFTVIISYNDNSEKIKHTGSIKRKKIKYEHKDISGKYLSKKEYNIFRRRQIKKFNITDNNPESLEGDEVKLELCDDEMRQCLLGYQYNKNRINAKAPVEIMPSFLCAQFGDNTAYNENKINNTFGNNENAFVLPSLVGISSTFGSGKIYSLKIDNLDETLNQQEFKEYINYFGITNYKDIRLIMCKRKNRDGSFDILDKNRGFGFIEFFSMKNAEEAKELLDGQRIGLQIISTEIEEKEQ